MRDPAQRVQRTARGSAARCARRRAEAQAARLQTHTRSCPACARRAALRRKVRVHCAAGYG